MLLAKLFMSITLKSIHLKDRFTQNTKNFSHVLLVGSCYAGCFICRGFEITVFWDKILEIPSWQSETLLPLSLFLRLFSGTLVHGLHRYLKGGRAAESLLAGGSLSEHLYSSLLDAVRSSSSKAHLSSSAAGRGRRGRGRGRGRRGRGRGGGRRGAVGGGRGTDEINNRFELLMSEEEFDYDWWGGGEK